MVMVSPWQYGGLAEGMIRKVYIIKKLRWIRLLWFAMFPAVLWAQGEVVLGPTTVETPIYYYKIIRSYPHDRQAFTQGLVYSDGVFYEGTGLYGRSSLRKIDLASGRVLKMIKLDPSYFGEGITVIGNRIVQVTWRSHMGFVYDKKSFRLLQKFIYPHEGWGVTHDSQRIIMSDGTSVLHFLDPKDFRETAKIDVHDERGPVTGLNELEYVKGSIYANVWPTDYIADINPKTGHVQAWIDLRGLRDKSDSPDADVLNGIAYDAQGDRLFVAGKLWSKVFEIRLINER
jgi:glutamine cyclotransferase